MLKLTTMKPTLLLLNLLFALQSFSQCSSGSLLKVKTTRTTQYEYVIFTFKGKTAPIFTIATVSPPFTASPSGEPLAVTGCKFRSVKYQGNVYCTVSDQTSSLPFSVVKDVKNADQFEGYYEYIIGLRCAKSAMINYTYRAGANTVRVLRFKR